MAETASSVIMDFGKFLDSKFQELTVFFTELTHLQIIYAGFAFLLFIWTYLFIRVETHLYKQEPTIKTTMKTNHKKNKRKNKSTEISLNVTSDKEEDLESLPEWEPQVIPEWKKRVTELNSKKKFQRQCQIDQIRRLSSNKPGTGRNCKIQPGIKYISLSPTLKIDHGSSNVTRQRNNRNCKTQTETDYKPLSPMPKVNHGTFYYNMSGKKVPKVYSHPGLCLQCAKYGTCIHSICMDIQHNCGICYDKACLHSTTRSRQR
jgi:hypothetical protein